MQLYVFKYFSGVPDLPQMVIAPKRTISSALDVLIEALSLRQRQGLDTSSQEPPLRPIVEHKVAQITSIYTSGVPAMSTEDILAQRQSALGGNMALFFPDEPLHIVKGRGCELFDPEGTSYLDCEYLSLNNNHNFFLQRRDFDISNSGMSHFKSDFVCILPNTQILYLLKLNLSFSTVFLLQL